MERRELLKMIAVLTGTVMVGGEYMLTGCKRPAAVGGPVFTNADIAFLDEVAETILPATNTPGAKAAGVGRFMTVMVDDTYEEQDQQVFHQGIGKLEEDCRKEYNKSFMEMTPEERAALLTRIDKEASDYQKNKKSEEPKHYYTLMKQLTIFGYFTSKEGATMALRYLPVPGKFEGDIPYKKGDKAWAI